LFALNNPKIMPAVLDREKAKVDGLAFMGLSLSHRSEQGNPLSAAHQQAFDFNRLTDRDYRYIQSSDDDGWMIGGGEPETSYKFPAPDSAHVELMHIGTYTQSLGGLDPVVLAEALKSGEILIPEMAVVPTSVCLNDSKPPDLIMRFDMIPNKPNLEFPVSAPLPANWQLRFVHNQLFKRFHFPCRYCTQPFHAKMMGKVEFRSKQAEEAYMAKCQAIINEWLERGQQPLVPPKNGGKDSSIKTLRCKKWAPAVVSTGDDYLDGYYKSGIWLFTDRNTPTHQFMPNFLPPYDTPAKRKIILDVLREEWDESILDWKPLYKTPPMSLNGNKSKEIELEGMDKINKKTGGAWDLLGHFKDVMGFCGNMNMGGSMDDDLSAMSLKAAKKARIKSIANSMMGNIMSPTVHEAYTEEEEDEYVMTDEERDESELGMGMSSMNSSSFCDGSLSGIAGAGGGGGAGVIALKSGMQRSRSEKPRSGAGLLAGHNQELEDTASF
jgi:hypothetical protein